MANKIYPITRNTEGGLIRIKGSVEKDLLVTLSSNEVAETSADTDLIVGVSKGVDLNDSTKTAVQTISSETEVVIPAENLTTDATFIANVAAGKMVPVYFTGTTFTYSATDNTLAGYVIRKDLEGYVVRFISSVLYF